YRARLRSRIGSSRGPRGRNSIGVSGDVVIALDVGGTGMKCALVQPDGVVHHTERHPTLADRGPEAVTANILDVAAGLADRARAAAAGIGRRYAELSGVAAAAAFDVAARAAAGEALATAVWTEAVEALADGLLTAQALYDAGTVVLGGGLAEAGEALLTPLRV